MATRLAADQAPASAVHGSAWWRGSLAGQMGWQTARAKSAAATAAVYSGIIASSHATLNAHMYAKGIASLHAVLLVHTRP